MTGDQVVECDAQTGAHQQVGHHGHGRQVLEVRHVAEQYERQGQSADVPPGVYVHLDVMEDHLLEVLGNDHGVHAARAEVRDEQEPEHQLPG